MANKHFLTIYELFLFLYVDDGATIFSIRNDAILVTKICYNEMKRLGLKIYTGIGGNLQRLKQFISLQDLKFNLGLKITKKICYPSYPHLL